MAGTNPPGLDLDALASVLSRMMPPATAQLQPMPTPPTSPKVSVFGRSNYPNDVIQSLAQKLSGSASVPKWQIELVDDDTWKNYQKNWNVNSAWAFSRHELGTTYLRANALPEDQTVLYHALAHELGHIVNGVDEKAAEQYAKQALGQTR